MGSRVALVLGLLAALLIAPASAQIPGGGAQTNLQTGVTGILGAGNGGTGSTQGVGGTPFQDSLGGAQRSAAARFGDYLDARSISGVYADTQIQYGALTITAGQASLHCGSCNFVSGDQGKLAFLQGAGTTYTTGAVTVVAVSAGGTYTGQPSVVFTGANSTPATGEPWATAISAMSAVTSIATGGSGCTNGSGITATMAPTGTHGGASGGIITAPTVLVTVSGNAVTATGTVTGGSLWNMSAPGGSAVQFTVPGCTTQPTLNVTYTVTSVMMISGGWNNPTSGVTAALSGGTFSVAGTLGAVTVGAQVEPLFSTIQTVTDAQDVVLSNLAGTSLTTGSWLFEWGHDDIAAINTEVASICGTKAFWNGGVGVLTVHLPSGLYGIGSQLTIPDNCNVSVDGDGRGLTWAMGLAALGVNPAGASASPTPASSITSFIFKANSNATVNLSNFSIWMNHAAAIPVWMHGFHDGSVHDMGIYDAAPQVAGAADFVVGDPFAYFYAAGLHYNNNYIRATIQNNQAGMALNGMAIYSTDNIGGDNNEIIDGSFAAYVDTGGNPLGPSHVFGPGPGQGPQYGYSLSSLVNPSTLYRPEPDTTSVAGIFDNGTVNIYGLQCVWSNTWGTATPSSECVSIGSGINFADYYGINLGTPGLNGSNVVVQSGSAGTTKAPTWTQPTGYFASTAYGSGPLYSGGGFSYITQTIFNSLSLGWEMNYVNYSLTTPGWLPSKTDAKAGISTGTPGDVCFTADVASTATGILCAVTAGGVQYMKTIIAANLPTCNAANNALQVVVSDILVFTAGGTLTTASGGGSIQAFALCNGSTTTWTAH